MKKSVLPALLIALAASSTVYAGDIKADISSFEFNVFMESSETTQRPTIQLLDAERKKVVYMGEGKSVFDDENDTYIFNFEKFSVPKTLETGAYILRVGGKGIVTEELRVNFINDLDKSNALNMLDSASDKGEVLISRAVDLGVDKELYSSLAPDWRKVVDDKIAEVDLENDGTENDVAQKYDQFRNAYDYAMELAVIAGSEDAKAVEEMIEKSEKLGIKRDGFYSKLSDKSAVAKLLSAAKYPTDIKPEQLVKEFDGAVLVSVIKQLDYGSAEEALKNAVNDGILNMSFDEYNRLSETNRIKVLTDLKQAGITKYTDIPSKFTQAVNKYLSSNNTMPGGGSPGGGGGAGKGVAVSAPVSEQAKNASSQATAEAGNSQSNIPAKAFSDMDDYSWAKEAVDSLTERGVVSGDGNGRFNPGNNITREEFSKILILAFDLYDSDAQVSFEDVPADSWFYRYVASAVKNGVVKGISDSSFGTGAAITRQDMTVMLCRVYKMFGKDITGNVESYLDAADISDYAKDAVATLSSAGVLNGSDGKFMPRESLTRAQGAKAVYELMKLMEVKQ